jgi:SulP family sulfate permease
MLGVVVLTIAIVLLFPKITKTVPASLVAIMVVFAVVLLFNIETKTVEDIASVQGGFPPFHIPNIPVSFETLKIIFPYSVIVAAVGLTEGLLTLNLVDEITGTRGNSTRKLKYSKWLLLRNGRLPDDCTNFG